MNKTVKIILYPFTFFCIILIYFYKVCISPLIPKTCKFTPTCSTYTINALKEFGFIKGSYLSIKRICRCNPFCSCSGYDPIPYNIKGDIKWLI